MKTAFMIIGMVAVGIVVFVAAVFGFVAYEGTKFDASSKAYIDANIPPIISNWSREELEKRESDGFRSATTTGKLDELFGIFRRLGPMKSYDGARGDANMNVTPAAGLEVTARYIVKATFQNGPAEILVILVRVDGNWQILGFRVNSDALITR